MSQNVAEQFQEFYEQERDRYLQKTGEVYHPFLTTFEWDSLEKLRFESVFTRMDVPLVRSLLFWFLRKNNVHEEHSTNMTIALEESLTNILRHSYLPNQEKWVRMEFCKTPNFVTLSFWDYGIQGTQFPLVGTLDGLSQKGVPPILGRGGLGLFMIKRMMDNIQYSTKEKQNHLVLQKTILSQQEEPLNE